MAQITNLPVYNRFADSWREAHRIKGEILNRDEPFYVEIGNHVLHIVQAVMSCNFESYKINTQAPRIDMKARESTLTIDIVQDLDAVQFFKHDSMRLEFKFTQSSICFLANVFSNQTAAELFQAIEFEVMQHFSPAKVSAVYANAYTRRLA